MMMMLVTVMMLIMTAVCVCVCVCVCLAVSGYDVQTLNIPTVDQYISHYAQLTSSDCVHNWSFYVAFVMFRTAAIAQGVYKRFTLGTTPFLPPLSLSLSLSLSVFVCLSVCVCLCVGCMLFVVDSLYIVHTLFYVDVSADSDLEEDQSRDDYAVLDLSMWDADADRLVRDRRTLRPAVCNLYRDCQCVTMLSSCGRQATRRNSI